MSWCVREKRTKRDESRLKLYEGDKKVCGSWTQEGKKKKKKKGLEKSGELKRGTERAQREIHERKRESKEAFRE